MSIPRSRRNAFTLVELLVVISIIGLLVALLTPAIYLARESARSATCQSNLRQIGLGMQTYAQSTQGGYCSGAWDWQLDGAVTELGWVADQVNSGNPVGSLLCPSNEAQLSFVYHQLQTVTAADFSDCVDAAGSQPTLAPDGTALTNPSRQLLGIAAGAARKDVIKDRIYDKFYNTNYCASWFLARGGANLNATGYLTPTRTDCTPAGTSMKERVYTKGPLRESYMSAVSVSVVPLVGDANSSQQTLSIEVGDIGSGTPLAITMTDGMRRKADMSRPTGGATKAVWWADWARNSIQDYRQFGAIHRGSCNIVFADGHVGTFRDLNDDGILNNGFPATSGGGFTDDTEEASPDELDSYYSLSDKQVRDI